MTTLRQPRRKRSSSRSSVAGGAQYSLEQLFPKKKGIDYSALHMTPEGEYSITRRKDGEKLLEHMKSILGSTKKKTITDLTGNVGGDTILFGMHFLNVNSIELDKQNFDAHTFLQIVNLHHSQIHCIG